jgi:polyribonucleotide nucleotidyltransferase
MNKREYRVYVGEREFVVETGHLAEQAGGALTLREGETTIFASATMSAHPREGVNFLPLSVDVEERLYAVGRIPGSWFRREGRPPVNAILTARMTDRPLRPLFPKNLRNAIQVILMPLTHDQVHQHDVLAMNAASAALHISDIPWEGPIGAVRVGLLDGDFVVNPTYEQAAHSTLDLRMAGTADSIVMVECAATEVNEETMIAALEFGHDAMQPFIALQQLMRREIGKDKREINTKEIDEGLRADVTGRVQERVTNIVSEYYDRDERNEELDDLREQLLVEYEGEAEEAEIVERLSDVREVYNDVIKKSVRDRILHEGVRPDGRKYEDLRDLSADVDTLPRVHGVGLFKRGQTQVMSILTLGTLGDVQEFDELEPMPDGKRYLHHYNFPPYSTGETWFLRGPKRREIGHGMLAENALRPVLPHKDDFPYTIRVVSEVMSSNGSTSMAAVCGSSLALMDGGVPITAQVAGIAMGLVTDGEKYAVLTDIQGMEDHLGDMDFKVAGTREGITALQMDIKIKGIPRETMAQALNQALDARMQILDVMDGTTDAPREELKEHAPRMTVINIPKSKIRNVIGKGGETIRGIQNDTNTEIHIEEDGTVFVAATNKAGADAARSRIEALTESPEPGRIYTGKVTRIENYGVFVEILPGTDGMVHVSQLDTYRVPHPSEVVSVGDEIMVMVTDITHDGKIRLSRQAVLEGWSLEEAVEQDAKAKGGRGKKRR